MALSFHKSLLLNLDHTCPPFVSVCRSQFRHSLWVHSVTDLHHFLHSVIGEWSLQFLEFSREKGNWGWKSTPVVDIVSQVQARSGIEGQVLMESMFWISGICPDSESIYDHLVHRFMLNHGPHWPGKQSFFTSAIKFLGQVVPKKCSWNSKVWKTI